MLILFLLFDTRTVSCLLFFVADDNATQKHGCVLWFVWMKEFAMTHLRHQENPKDRIIVIGSKILLDQQF